ncbi:MAG: CinA family nicotinamide mononucleotide deamidase-related protein [Halobacteriovoraceae bacterium]|nr:CinA family nicotinamide mononucleotide deamidase-related protein [Halobacteriovoraceae bacterium]
MRIEVLAIGNELVGGMRSDTNSAFLANFLKRYGLDLSRITVLPDDPNSIKSALIGASRESDIVFLSGGLGPTKDDMTKKVLSDFFSAELTENKLAEDMVRKHYQRLSKTWNKKNGYHLIPRGFEAIFNHTGLAPGLMYRKEKKFFLAAPGVPSEFSAMVEKEFFPRLLKDIPGLQPMENLSLTVRTQGVPEEKIFQTLMPNLWNDLEKWGKVASLPRVMGVDIIISRLENEESKKEIRKFLSNTPLAPHIWQIGNIPLNEWVLQKARQKKLSIVLAESCTGGLLASRLTDIPGSSSVFKGGVVAYSNACKQNILGVSEKTIRRYGVYSKETAVEMAKGARKILKGDIALSLSGVIGPQDDGETPVGTLAVGRDFSGESKGELFFMKGDRSQLKERFVQKALYLLLSILQKNDSL